MSTITKELAKLFRKITNSEIDAEGNAHVVLSPADSLLINNARIALASLEAHSADDVSDAELNAALLLHRLKVEGHSQLSDAFRAGFKYARRTAPPAPASVPDERYQHLSELYHAQEKRLFKLAQRINGPSFDKYAYSPSQAIDVLESAIFGERKDEDCRAAMLQAGNSPSKCSLRDGIEAIRNSGIPVDVDKIQSERVAGNHTEKHLDMVDHFVDANEKGKDGTLINEGTMPATQIKPVADLYGITSPTGSETTFTFDASEASSFAKSGWTVQEYVELERYQQSVTGNSPEVPDCWIPVSERMPEDEQEVIVHNKLGCRYVSYFDEHSGLFFDMKGGNQVNCIEHILVTHWMPSPSEPQKE